MERFDWKSIIGVNIYILRIVGLWPKDSQFYNLNLYTLYATISVVFFVTVGVLLQSVNVFFVSSDLKALTQTMLFAGSETLVLWKMYTFIRNIRKLKGLLVTLDNDDFQPRSIGQILLIRPALKTWNTMYKSLLGGVILGAIVWLLFPIISGSTRTYKLPLPVWYPYDINSLLVYVLTYLHQTVSGTIMTLAGYNIDMLNSALMMYVGTQCDILCDNLRYPAVTSDNFESMLKQCIVHHKKLLRFSENCNDFFDLTTLGQFIISSMCLAICLFQLALAKPSTAEFFTYFITVLSLVLQIFAYCWFGNEVQIKSNKIAYACFESPWIQQRQLAKKTLIIFTERVQIPIKLSTLKLFYLSLETFVKILRSAVSYYTILRQLGLEK